ncbi:MAG: pyruvate ferredoxin oxidoreductase subunit gamma [Methanobrevibacter sp.]|jgi:pyruvate ferredoxin oxidoreductase gamma subunit|nr:pyruvate ferredoxin oxidoreductase subunit gamma [Methanobrevibacter sp.]
MIEIRFHGRGGQGSVTASEILAKAAFEDGKYSQAFPFFGVERRGAPVMAFTRIDDKPIEVRYQVYSPDYVVVLDEGLLEVVDVYSGLKDDGSIIINTTKNELSSKDNVSIIDATGIALDNLGVNIVNTVMLGSFAKKSGLISLDSILNVIKRTFSGSMGQKNAKAAEIAYEQIK